MNGEPIDSVEWVHWRKLSANDWNPNTVMRQELDLLELNILTLGWVQPVIALRCGKIVDGFHRWLLSQKSKAFLETWGGMVPVVYVDLPEHEAKALTVRMNRARGVHGATEMAAIAKDLAEATTDDEAKKALGMTTAEFDTLKAKDVFKALKVDQHAYSKAWVPYESK